MTSRRLLAFAALTVLMTVTGCGSGGDDPPSTQATPSAEEAAPKAVPFSFDGLPWRFTVAPDGNTAVVSLSTGFFPSTRESRLFELTRQSDGSWDDPQPLPFSGEDAADIDAFFVDQGQRMWFSSIRPVDGQPRTDTDLWYVDRAADGSWGQPVHGGAAINSTGDELYPTIGPDGTLWTGSNRGGDWDIIRVAANPDGSWGEASVLPAPVTTDSWEYNPVLAPDGQTLVFGSLNRSGGEGVGDIWYATPTGDSWSEPQPLAAVNTEGDEYHPSFSPDGQTMYFVRQGELFEVPLTASGLPT